MGVEAHQREIKANGQKSVGVIVGIKVLIRLKAIMKQDIETPDANDEGNSHIKIKGKITPEGMLQESAYHHGGLKAGTQEPDCKIKWTRHFFSFLCPGPSLMAGLSYPTKVTTRALAAVARLHFSKASEGVVLPHFSTVSAGVVLPHWP
jgi:hypothetical protein